MKRDYTEAEPVEAVFKLTAINKHTGHSLSFDIPWNPMLKDIINTEHANYLTFIDVQVKDTQ